MVCKKILKVLGNFCNIVEKKFDRDQCTFSIDICWTIKSNRVAKSGCGEGTAGWDAYCNC